MLSVCHSPVTHWGLLPVRITDAVFRTLYSLHTLDCLNVLYMLEMLVH